MTSDTWVQDNEFTIFEDPSVIYAAQCIRKFDQEKDVCRLHLAFNLYLYMLHASPYTPQERMQLFESIYPMLKEKYQKEHPTLVMDLIKHGLYKTSDDITPDRDQWFKNNTLQRYFVPKGHIKLSVLQMVFTDLANASMIDHRALGEELVRAAYQRRIAFEDLQHMVESIYNSWNNFEEHLLQTVPDESPVRFMLPLLQNPSASLSQIANQLSQTGNELADFLKQELFNYALSHPGRSYAEIVDLYFELPEDYIYVVNNLMLKEGTNRRKNFMNCLLEVIIDLSSTEDKRKLSNCFSQFLHMNAKSLKGMRYRDIRERLLLIDIPINSNSVLEQVLNNYLIDTQHREHACVTASPSTIAYPRPYGLNEVTAQNQDASSSPKPSTSH